MNFSRKCILVVVSFLPSCSWVDGVMCKVETRDLTVLQRDTVLYPEKARKQGVEGWVVVEYTVTKSGKTKNISVIDSHPKGVFEAVALEEAASFTFLPKVEDCWPQEVVATQSRIIYTLE